MASKINSSALQTGMNEDNFYDSVESSTAEYDNTLNQHAVPLDPDERDRQAEEWKAELLQLEEEILTLKAVLNTKVRESSELKRKLGITPMVELKQDLQHGITAIRDSEPVQKTNEKLHQLGDSIASSDAYQKTNAAFKSFGAFASKKLGDFRNSAAFKSVEDKVGGAYSSIKQSRSMGNIRYSSASQMSGSQSTNEFDGAQHNGSESDNRKSQNYQ